MEMLYKTTTKYTLEEYKKYNKALLKDNNFYRKLVILEILILLLGILSGNVKDIIFSIMVAILFPVTLFIILDINIKKVFNSNKVTQNVDVYFEFYEDCFIEKHENGESKIEYSKLDKIIETETNVYLMIAKNQGYMLLKENFPNGLSEFLKNMNKEN